MRARALSSVALFLIQFFLFPVISLLPTSRSLAVFLCLIGLAAPVVAQVKVKSTPFSYVPDATADPYAERVPNKLLPLAGGAFLLLTRQSATQYVVERYAGAEMKKNWACPLTLAPGEGIDAFATTPESATILTYQADPVAGTQALYGYRIAVGTGQATSRRELLGGTRGRRLYASLSDDGTRVVAFRTNLRQTQISSLDVVTFDNAFQEQNRFPVDLQGAGAGPSVTVRISNAGDVVVGLITDGGIQLTVRRYPAKGTDAQVLGVPIGGTYGGHKVYIFDTAYRFDEAGALYAAAICMDEESGDYHSLKVVKYDFAANDMRFADEFRFTPAYLKELETDAAKHQATAPKRLADTYLSDVLLTAEKQVVVVAERKEEEGEKSPHYAKEVLLFGYNEFSAPTWHGVLWKNQQAPAEEGYAGIGYKAQVQGTTIHLLTLETLNKKADLYDHPFSALTGKPLPVRALGLNVTTSQPVSYVKDFTAWLDARTVLAVSRPAKKSNTLNLNRIVLK